MSDEPLTDSKQKKLQESLVIFREWKKFISSIPDRDPVLISSKRPVGSSGVFIYRLSGLDYHQLSDRLFKKRKKDFKKRFVEYLTQLFSILIESELLPDGSLTTDSIGTEVYSLDLKKISRNYSDFNDVLIRDGFLHVLGLHQKGERCRTYGVPRELLRKGIEKVFLSDDEKRTLVKTIRVEDGPDKTSPNLSTVCRYYSDLIKRTTILTSDFDRLEIELGRFRDLYPKVIRHQDGKLDLKLGPKEGRLYSVYLYAPKEFRGLLRFDGTKPMVEGDVGGSHFHFLLGKMTDPVEREQMKKDLLSPDSYRSMCGNSLGVKREDLKKSSHSFKYGNRVTKSFPMTDYEWSKVVPYKEGLFYRHLSKKYPVFTDTMSKMKISHKKHRSDFSCEIMRRESDVMVQTVGRRCQSENLVYLPIHDGFLTLPEHYDRVCEIVVESFQGSTGSTPRIKRKG